MLYQFIASAILVLAEVTSTDEERTAARLPKHNTQDGQERE